MPAMRQAVHSQVVAPEVLPHCLLPRSLRRQAPPKKDVPKLQQAVLPLLLVPGLLQKGVPPVLSQAGAGTQKDVPDVRQAVLALPFVPSLLQQGMPPVLSQAGAGTRKDVPDVQQAVLTLTFLASLLQQGMPLVAERRSPQSRPGAGSPRETSTAEIAARVGGRTGQQYPQRKIRLCVVQGRGNPAVLYRHGVRQPCMATTHVRRQDGILPAVERISEHVQGQGRKGQPDRRRRLVAGIFAHQFPGDRLRMYPRQPVRTDEATGKRMPHDRIRVRGRQA